MKRILIPILTCIAAMSYAQTMPNNIVNVDNDEYATQPWVVTNSTGVATNTGANGNVLTKNGTDVYWSAAGVGDAVLAGNQVFTGSNQFTGKLQITTNTPTAAQVAKYNATSGKWYAAPDTGGSDTTFTNYLAGSGFVTITGAARSGSNTINGVANGAFTNAVQAAQSNVVDTTYTAGSGLSLTASTVFALSAASIASDAHADTAFGWGDHATNGYLTWVASPAATNSAGTAGMAAYSANYLYICVSNATWRRTILSAWH